MEKKIIERITNFIFREDTPVRADAIFIPGNGYPQPSEQAAKLYQAGLSPWIIPSGMYSITKGQFEGVHEKKETYKGNYKTEAAFMKDVMVQNGVPQEAILCEERATYTYQNAIFSREITDKMGLEIKRGIICCVNYHARRSYMYYKLKYPDTEFYICPAIVEGITKENWYKSEEGIDRVLGEIERCTEQFYKMLK